MIYPILGYTTLHFVNGRKCNQWPWISDFMQTTVVRCQKSFESRYNIQWICFLIYIQNAGMFNYCTKSGIWQLLFICLMCLSFWICHLIRTFLLFFKFSSEFDIFVLLLFTVIISLLNSFWNLSEWKLTLPLTSKLYLQVIFWGLNWDTCMPGRINP